MKEKLIVLAADHAGFELKEKIKVHLESKGIKILDVGAHSMKQEDDYPVYMSDAGMKVAADMEGNTKAIIFGGSGQGEAIMANRFPGVRATVWYGGPLEIVKLGREHNDSNVLSIGARFVADEEVKKAVDLWIETPFSNDERHSRRNNQIDSIE